MGSLKNLSAAEKTLSAKKATEATVPHVEPLEIGKEVSLKKALELLNSDEWRRATKSQLPRIRKPVIDAVINSEIVRGRATFISGIPRGEQEESIAKAIANRFRGYRCLNMKDLEKFNPVRSPGIETIVVYGFPTQGDRTDDVVSAVLRAVQGLNKAREKQDDKGHIIVLSHDKADASRLGEMEQTFKFGHLTEVGVKEY